MVSLSSCIFLLTSAICTVLPDTVAVVGREALRGVTRQAANLFRLDNKSEVSTDARDNHGDVHRTDDRPSPDTTLLPSGFSLGDTPGFDGWFNFTLRRYGLLPASEPVPPQVNASVPDLYDEVVSLRGAILTLAQQAGLSPSNLTTAGVHLSSEMNLACPHRRRLMRQEGASAPTTQSAKEAAGNFLTTTRSRLASITSSSGEEWLITEEGEIS
ncbi:unnamed protein product [Vitrella brassicaformis CCMP3155]|uniref:Uncharacterized protein n=1 Tax=Vitrella brassicaformis (strain CCMP3155) TaxID=1169540 RepID=A0A0G4E8R4_VITBC|nr:unnamed protein product [Vitrella brassicaformis CCMP3155]|eukprot:CEL92271.1 unnamed protein product [Vitrella brassicaformis CCMP3155]